MPGVIEGTATSASDKLRGGYYTPESLAAWLCRWAVRSNTDNVLEPSSGDGIFLGEACKRLVQLGASPNEALCRVRGIEIIAEEAKKSRARIKSIVGTNPNGQIICTDFFAWVERDKARYQCVVGNPPFIRYQHFPEPSRSAAMRMMAGYGLRPNKLTNIWVPFVVAGISLLREVVASRWLFLRSFYRSVTQDNCVSDSPIHFAVLRSTHATKCLFEHAEKEAVLVG
jgi:adenine-specific DNA-methyltransferase